MQHIAISPVHTRQEILSRWKLSHRCGIVVSPRVSWVLGPLHTCAKSRDHDIVRAQKKVPKGRPKTPPKSCSVVIDPQVECEVICKRTLNQMLYQ